MAARPPCWALCGNAGILKCKGCSTAHYCSRECCREDWRAGHRTQCPTLVDSGDSSPRAAWLANARWHNWTVPILLQIPDELVAIVLEFLTVKEILAVGGTCARLRSLVTTVRVLRTHRSLENVEGRVSVNAGLGFLSLAEHIQVAVVDATRHSRRVYGQSQPLDVETVARHCPELRQIRVVGSQCGDIDLAGLNRHCRRLQALVTNHTEIGDAGLLFLSTIGHGLKVLVVSNSKITDDGVESLVEFFQNLQILDVSGTFISDAGIMMAATGLPKLRYLTVGKPQKNSSFRQALVTDGCVAEIRARFPRLVVSQVDKACSLEEESPPDSLSQLLHFQLIEWQEIFRDFVIDDYMQREERKEAVKRSAYSAALEEQKRLSSRELRRSPLSRQPSNQRPRKCAGHKTKNR
eukprot:m.232745 g.232745  ORF g.232745 m.232745 type:complete len:408 (-) comp15721_c0_seq4:1535-2758(-)